jgi:TPR repeat protein
MMPRHLMMAGALVALMTGSVFADAFADGLSAHNSGDYAAAISAWTPLAEGGDAKAQFNLGVLNDQGQGVAVDREAAIRWYTMAAEQGDARAQFNLGQIYASGDGVPQDGEAAVKWYGMAAEQGDVLARFNLALVHEEGAIVPQDYAEAARLYEAAATENKYHRAMYSLGNLYSQGLGVERDSSRAAELFGQANEAEMMTENSSGCTPRAVPTREECRRTTPQR